MTYFPEIRDALASAIDHDSSKPAEDRTRLLPRVASVAVPVASVLASLIIGAVIFLSVHHAGGTTTVHQSAAWRSVPAAWRNDSLKAMTAVSNRDRGCGLSLAGKAPREQRFIDGRPTAQLTSLLRVMRQPASPNARVSAKEIRRLNLDEQGVYVRYARQGVVDGVHYYMVPAAHLEPNELKPRCFAERLSDFKRLAAALPVAQRTRAVAFERARLHEQQASQPPGVVLVDVGGGSKGEAFRPVDVLRRDPWRGGGDGNDTITKTLLLVPNDAATVTARYAAQSYPGRVAEPVTVTKHVHDNFVMFVLRGAWDPPSLTYRSATGKVLWATPKH